MRLAEESYRLMKLAEMAREPRPAEGQDLLDIISFKCTRGNVSVETEEVAFMAGRLYVQSQHHYHVIERILLHLEKHGKLVRVDNGWALAPKAE